MQRDPETQTLSIHRLVQEVLKDQLDEQTRRTWAERTVRAMSRVFPDPEYANRDVCQKYLLHAQVCTSLIVLWNMTFPEAILLLNGVADYLHQTLFMYKEAETLFKHILSIRERMLGPDHFITAHSLLMLALIYIDQQKYEQAEPLYQRTLKIFENTLPPDHLLIADRLEGYASLLRNMNRTTEAEPLEERARTMRANHST